MLKKIVLFCGSIIFLIGCSSIGNVRQYTFDKATVEKYVTYDKYSYKQATFKYKQIYRNIFQNDLCQCAWIEIDQKYIQTYFVGPIFLPVFPVFFLNGQPPVDPTQLLKIRLSAYSPDEFHDQVISIPNLTIETPKGIFTADIAKPPIEKNRKEFTFPILVSETPWLIVYESEIGLSSGKKLKIPKTKFEMKSDTEFFWNLPIAP